MAFISRREDTIVDISFDLDDMMDFEGKNSEDDSSMEDQKKIKQYEEQEKIKEQQFERAEEEDYLMEESVTDDGLEEGEIVEQEYVKQAYVKQDFYQDNQSNNIYNTIKFKNRNVIQDWNQFIRIFYSEITFKFQKLPIEYLKSILDIQVQKTEEEVQTIFLEKLVYYSIYNVLKKFDNLDNLKYLKMEFPSMDNYDRNRCLTIIADIISKHFPFGFYQFFYEMEKNYEFENLVYLLCKNFNIEPQDLTIMFKELQDEIMMDGFAFWLDSLTTPKIKTIQKKFNLNCSEVSKTKIIDDLMKYIFNLN